MRKVRITVTFPVNRKTRNRIDARMGGRAEVSYLKDVSTDERPSLLACSDVLLSFFGGGEFDSRELKALEGGKIVQLISAGADHLPFEELPEDLEIHSNSGGWARPMAEHVTAMVLSLSRYLPQLYWQMARGKFDKKTFQPRSLEGKILGVVGYGGIGRASSEMLKRMGMRVHAINSTGRSDGSAEFFGTLKVLPALLKKSDVLLLSLPLTKETVGLIGREQLEMMKSNAMLINVARAGLLDEEAIYDHLRANPNFGFGNDVWWNEPKKGHSFSLNFPFFDLPNLIATPHDSNMMEGAYQNAADFAMRNIERHLDGEPMRGAIRREDYL